MKSKTLYTCEICNTDYSDKAKAKECEKGHQTYEVIENRYHGINMGGEYPYVIVVEFKDGTKRMYKKRGSIND